MDKFQERYLAHQERKTKQLDNGDIQSSKFYTTSKESLSEVLEGRKSRRIYRGKLQKEDISVLIEKANLAPSSCNRHGVYLKEAPKDLIELLIGGKGWCNKGTVLAFFADMTAYKSPYEKEFMPYLDTGFMAQNIYLMCEVMGLGCCFINPNTHNQYKSEHLLTGAMAIGKL